MNVRAVAVVLAVLVPTVAWGHEIGTTNVRLKTDRPGHWIAAITTAPRALVNKLEAEAGLPKSQDLDAPSLRGRLEPLLERIASHLELRFDGTLCRPLVRIGTLEVPADVTRPSFVVLTVSCDAAATPATITWRDDLVYSTYAVTLESARGTQTVWIDGDATASLSTQPHAASNAGLAVVPQYLLLGFTHIVPKGLDHILFILGLFLLTRSVRPILVQVTSFTLAHSLTLALTMYGVVSLPSSVVEPLIAISIAYVAIENIFTDRIVPWRPVLVFGFGLLHGMGFAGVLRDLQLPRASFIPALVSFNVGVEVAQLTVIVLAFVCTRGMWHRGALWYRARVVVPASAAIALTAIVWTVERVAGN